MHAKLFPSVVVLAAAILSYPARAITYGQPDSNDEYPWVGMMISPAPGGGYFICSGSLVAPTVFVTAAHCLDNPDAPFFVTFKQAEPYPESSFVPGTPHQHPGWTGSFTIPNTSDVGVIILDQPQPGPYGQLAPVGFVDKLLRQRGTQDLGFTAIGYGLQSSQPTTSRKPSAPWDLARWFGFQRLMQANSAYTNGFSIQLTNNPGVGNGSGGTCSGDSGGPIMHSYTGYIVAVNSFGIARYCKGNDYAYRVDIRYSRDFIDGFLP